MWQKLGNKTFVKNLKLAQLDFYQREGLPELQDGIGLVGISSTNLLIGMIKIKFRNSLSYIVHYIRSYCCRCSGYWCGNIALYIYIV